jgi:hypothetical protein
LTDNIGNQDLSMVGHHAQAQLERVLCWRESTDKQVCPWHPGITEVARQNSLGRRAEDKE